MVVGHKEELLGVLSSGELGQVGGSTFPGSMSAGQRVERERNSVPGGGEVGRVASPVSLPPLDAILNPLFLTDVWLLQPGSQSPNISPFTWLRAGFPHPQQGLLTLRPPSCPLDPVSGLPALSLPNLG